ncbi:hypothetical protein DUZ99_06615 [Xylanibacillus composti]|uniref:KipI antagonist n=1 Tax=Xylanibacillus composti TaxID=1572762 RepID=A0A8J4H503_9BACL|nr:biotin-dependent carboxyltransferase family protein [Xylanibacillus composti]MDT9724664.1 hypothetical protein [Xylanibacillus composti]GIQ70949.1 KipI antagonist [Xylanibacillus composti]
MAVKVIKPGLHTTVQDGGRWGYQRYGVSVSGPMDSFAQRAANILVGNDDGEAVLEATLLGPELCLTQPCWVALCGADMRPLAGGKPIPMWRPVYLPADTVLALGRAAAGCRTYIAFAGGLQLPHVLGSRSTHTRSGLGGLRGSTLAEGDELAIGLSDPQLLPILPAQPVEAASVPWSVSPSICPDYADSAVVRTIDAPETSWYAAGALERFYGQTYTVAPDSDRMGIRLAGAQHGMHPLHAGTMHSSPVTCGTVQLPPDGKPIVLAADRQTTGGYPRIAQVISSDMPILAQLRPGDELRFHRISHAAAEQLGQEREHALTMLRTAVRLAGKR